MAQDGIDQTSGVPVYRQLADILRLRIERGDLAPGQRLPGELDLAHEYGLGRDSVRAAIALLRQEGLVATRRPAGTVVRGAPQRQLVLLPAGARLILRMPTLAERREHEIPEGVPVGEVHYKGRDWLYAGDQYEFRSQ